MKWKIMFLAWLSIALWLLAPRAVAGEFAVHGELVCADSGKPIHSAVFGGDYLPRREPHSSHELYWYSSFPALMEGVLGEFTWKPLDHSFRNRAKHGVERVHLLISAEGYRVWRSEELVFENSERIELGTIRLTPLETDLFRVAGKIRSRETGMPIPSAKLHFEIPHSAEGRAFALRYSKDRHFFELVGNPFITCGDPRDWSPPWPLEVHRTHANTYGGFELFVDESLDWTLVCVAKGYRPKSIKRTELLEHFELDGLQPLPITLEKDRPIPGTVRIDGSDREVTDPLSITWIHGELRETFPLLPGDHSAELVFTATGTEMGKGVFAISATSRWTKRWEPNSLEEKTGEILIDLRERQTFKTLKGTVLLPPALWHNAIYADLWKLKTGRLESGMHPKARMARWQISPGGYFELPAPSAGTYVIHINGQDRNGGVIVDKRVPVLLGSQHEAIAAMKIDATNSSCRIHMAPNRSNDIDSVWIERKSSRGWIDSSGFWAHANRPTLVYGLEAGIHEFVDWTGSMLGCFEASEASHQEIELRP